jgi:hypothetical protein
VFINPTTITTATLLSDLINTHATTITKKALQQRWTQQFADDNHTPPLPQSPNTPTARKLKKTLDALHKLGVIHHDRHHITITDHALLIRIANLS